MSRARPPCRQTACPDGLGGNTSLEAERRQPFPLSPKQLLGSREQAGDPRYMALPQEKCHGNVPHAAMPTTRWLSLAQNMHDREWVGWMARFAAAEDRRPHEGLQLHGKVRCRLGRA